VHQFGIRKYYLNTVDARYKHEESKIGLEVKVKNKMSLIKIYFHFQLIV